VASLRDKVMTDVVVKSESTVIHLLQYCRVVTVKTARYTTTTASHTVYCFLLKTISMHILAAQCYDTCGDDTLLQHTITTQCYDTHTMSRKRVRAIERSPRLQVLPPGVQREWLVYSVRCCLRAVTIQRTKRRQVHYCVLLILLRHTAIIQTYT
jgi:hypothetical protein